MRRFNLFQKSASNSLGTARPVLSEAQLQVLYQRAKHRVIGMAVLVILGVVLLPWFLDVQPRPIPSDIPIVFLNGSASPSANGPVSLESNASTADSTVEKTAAMAPPPVPPRVVPAPSSSNSSNVTGAKKPNPPVAVKSTATAETVPLYRVQVAVFSDVEKARDLRLKLQKAGFKVSVQPIYKQPRVENDYPSAWRVQIGPIKGKEEAVQVENKLKTLGLNAILKPVN